MLKRLKRLIEKLGAAKVASDLGYKSPSTIYHWIKKEQIPAMATVRVEKYIRGKRNVKKRS